MAIEHLIRTANCRLTSTNAELGLIFVDLKVFYLSTWLGRGGKGWEGRKEENEARNVVELCEEQKSALVSPQGVEKVLLKSLKTCPGSLRCVAVKKACRPHCLGCLGAEMGFLVFRW